jgi:S1-C subfamily serine protease
VKYAGNMRNLMPNGGPAQPPSSVVTIDPLFVCVTVIEMKATGTAPRPTRIGSATGFFYRHGESRYVITNRHVVVDEQQKFYPDTITLRVHTSPTTLTQNRDIDVPLYSHGSPIWLEHPTLRADADVVAIDISSYLQSTDVISLLASNLFVPNNVILGLTTAAYVIGYPRGFYDSLNNLPVVRNGTLASPYRVPFSGKPLFLIDANLHPGTSGSPVISPASATRRTTQALLAMGNFPPSLLGINSGGFNGLGLNAVWYPELIDDIVSRGVAGALLP